MGDSLTNDTKIKTSVVDLHWDPDPDPAFYLNADPDLGQTLFKVKKKFNFT